MEAIIVTHLIKVGRVYDAPTRADGARVLVDRIWPRGLSKEKAHLDEWCKTVAPSTLLRQWYDHDPARFEEFSDRYRVELSELERAEAVAHLRGVAKRRTLTLLTASRRADISEATVLAEQPAGRIPRPWPGRSPLRLAPWCASRRWWSRCHCRWFLARSVPAPRLGGRCRIGTGRRV